VCRTSPRRKEGRSNISVQAHTVRLFKFSQYPVTYCTLKCYAAGVASSDKVPCFLSFFHFPFIFLSPPLGAFLPFFPMRGISEFPIVAHGSIYSSFLGTGGVGFIPPSRRGFLFVGYRMIPFYLYCRSCYIYIYNKVPYDNGNGALAQLNLRG